MNELKHPSGVATPSGQAPGMALYKYTHQYKYWWAPASELQGKCHVFIDVADQEGLESIGKDKSLCGTRIPDLVCINPRGCNKHPLTYT